jgi:hypothetical protein
MASDEVEITDDQLTHLCSIVGIDLGVDKGMTCQILKEEIGSQSKRRKTGLTKAKLQPIASQMGLGKVWTIDQLLQRLETRQNPKKEEEEEKIISGRFGQKILSIRTIACIDYIGNGKINRFLTIVPIPKVAFNDAKQWRPSGGVSPGFLSCTNCGFYRSSGTSNEGKNFFGTWFPFLRVKETEKMYASDQGKGWIHKAYNLSTAQDFKKRLAQKFNILLTPFLDIFFEKFSHWWQIQISAALPSEPESHWENYKELMMLKPIVLSYDYVHFPDKGKEHFVENPNIIKNYRLADCGEKVTTPQEVNAWLAKNSALCIGKD